MYPFVLYSHGFDPQPKVQYVHPHKTQNTDTIFRQCVILVLVVQKTVPIVQRCVVLSGFRLACGCSSGLCSVILVTETTQDRQCKYTDKQTLTIL